MPTPLADDFDALPLAAERRVDEACLRFEATWKKGPRPCLEDFLAASSGIERLALLRELFLLDVHYRRSHGEAPALEDYLQRFPELDTTWTAEILFGVRDDQETQRALANGKAQPVAANAGGFFPLLQIGDYRILREVGRGGMGIVYEAEQESLGRHVALKVLPASALLNPTYLERFRCEAKAAARLHHTSIVPVFGVGECDGMHYYAMQFIQGESLDRVLSDLRRLREAPGAPPPAEGSVAHSLLTGRFAPPSVPPTVAPAASPTPPPATATDAARSSSTLSTCGLENQYFRAVARVALQVADALAYAHRQGILHRDIKPSNLLLDQQGTVWVTDFGLAKAEGADDLTQTGDIVGTVRFMAPERFDGRSLPQSDVYALGVTLYELLTLQPAFDEANKAKLIDKVLHEQPPPPRSLERSIPRDLETVVLKCLAKNPAERYPSADTLAEDLRRFLADRPIKARRTPWYERGWRWCRRNPLVASLLATVALLLLLLTAGTLVRNAELRKTLQESDAARREANEALWVSYRDQARAVRFSGRKGQRFEGLRAIRKALELPVPAGHSLDELRTEAIACLSLPDVEVVREWEGRPTADRGTAADEQIETYVCAEPQGQVSVRRTADDEVIARFTTSIKEAEARLSPNGHYLFLRGNTPNPRGTGPMEVWSLTDAKPKCCLTEPAAVFHWEAFSADSRRLAYLRPDGMMVVYDFVTGPVGRWRLPGRRMDWALAFHPDGQRLAVGVEVENRRVIQICDVATGAVTASLPQPTWCMSVAWHPDGQRLAVGAEDRRIHFWDTFSKKKLAIWEGHKRDGVALRGFNRAGDLLLSTDWNGTLRVWDTESGQQVFATPLVWELQAFPDGADGMCIFSSPDNGRRLRVLHLASGREHRRLVGRTPSAQIGYDRKALLSRDDRLLAFTMPSAAADRWDLALVDPGSGRRLATLPAASGKRLRPLGYEPSGALLTYDGGHGLLRWPVRSEPGSVRRIGPPQRLRTSEAGGVWGCSADGQVVAIPNFGSGAWVGRPEKPQPWIALQPQVDVRQCHVSPKGDLVATCSHIRPPNNEFGCKIWSVADGRLVKALSPGCGGEGEAGFSPDGRWLARADARGVRLWRVQSWEEGPCLSDQATGFAFAPDSALVAVGGESGVVRLCVTETGRELARLEVPDATRLSPVCFSHDGCQLFAFAEEDAAIHVWNLRRIRRRLAKLGLDWDAPPLEESKPEPGRQPLRVEVDLGDLVG